MQDEKRKPAKQFTATNSHKEEVDYVASDVQFE